MKRLLVPRNLAPLKKIFTQNSTLRLYSSAVAVQAQSNTGLAEQNTEGSVTVEVDQEQALALEIERRNQEIGVDLKFSPEKHSSVLAFPWANQDLIGKAVAESKAGPSSFWKYWFKHTPAQYELNVLYRELHQWCAIPDYEGIESMCEPQLAEKLSNTLKRIHFHGLDVEIEELTVDSKPQLLDVQIHKNLEIERTLNGSKDDWKSSAGWGGMGAPLKKWKRTDGQPYLGESRFDNLNENYKPYLIKMKVLFEGPMRLIVWNQNRSRVLFGGEEGEAPVKNIAQFEIKLKRLDTFKILPVDNKPLRTREWRLTDYNGLMNGNPFFLDS